MVPGHGMQPAFKIGYFIFEKVIYQPLKDLHNCILGIITVFKIFQAYPVNQVGIPLKEDGNDFCV
jgi:hypothetical protein